MADLAKKYSNTKYSLSIIGTIYTIALILVVLGSGFSLFLDNFLKSINLPHALSIVVFLLVISILYYLLNLPLNFYASFTLEHKFNLSKQKIGDWWLDQLKSGVLAFIISLILVSVFYWILDKFSYWWWL